MNVVLINKSFSKGGASIACQRLLNALHRKDIQAKMVVQEYSGDRKDVVATSHSIISKKINFVRFVWERLRFLPYEKSKEIRFAFSLANTGENLSKLKVIQEADIIHLHWINQGFLSLSGLQKLIKLGKPIVWTLHDMWPFTGGCHYPGTCEHFKTTCKFCPFLKNPSEKDLSNSLFHKKASIFSSPQFTWVGCSHWMALQASSSKMLANANVVNIPNPIGIDVYKKLDKADCKRKFNLPTNKKIILFGAAKVTDKRKGLSYLINSLKQLKATSTQDFLLVTFGRVVGFPELPFAHLPIEYLTDENAIVSLYNAADVFVVPSLEDNLPNTIMESLACGTPVVAFNTGGIPEMIDHKQNGYLAQLEDSADLAMGIQWILENQSYDLISEAAINKVKSNYTEENVADEYMKLYEKLLK